MKNFILSSLLIVLSFANAFAQTCASPTVITAPFASGSVTTCGAGNGGAASQCSTSYGGTEDAVVYSYTPTASGNITVNLTASATYGGVFFHTGGCAGTCVGSATTSSGTTANATFAVVAGTTYTVVVTTWAAPTCSPYTLTISAPVAPPAPPANNNCSGAIALTSSASCSPTPYTTVGATSSTVTPTGACTSSFGTPDDDVWFSFVATSASQTITLANTSGSTDIYFQVFSGSCGTTMTSVLCSDTDAGGTATGLTVGATYYVRVYTYFSAVSTTGTICIVTPPPPPANCSCSGASTAQICGSSTFTGNLDDNCGTFSGSSGCLTNTPRESWFLINVTTAGLLDLDILNSGGLDVDAALYGPFTPTSPAITACTAAAVGNPVVCDYSFTDGTSTDPALWANTTSSTPCSGTTSTSNCTYTASVGIYLLLITNFSTTAATITIGGNSASATPPAGTAVISCASPLNVEFTKFGGRLMKEHVELNWTTAAEINNDRYIVQRSFSGKEDDFSDIGFVDSKSLGGNSSIALYYNFMDMNARIGNNYYRIKQVDLDGSFQYSKVVNVEQKSNKYQVSNVFPNPTTGEINVSIESVREDEATATISNIFGAQVLSQKLSLLSGINGFNFDIQALPQGAYYLTIINSNNEKTVVKLMKN